MDAKLIAKGIIDGLASIPAGLYLSGLRTIEGSGLLGSELKARNEYETERFIRMLKALSSNEEPLRQLVTIIITDFYSKLDETSKKAISDKLGYAEAKMGSRTGAQFFIAKKISDLIVAKVRAAPIMSVVLRAASGFTFNILMIQGLIEEAARASRRMRTKYPATYFKVSSRNLDMVYFLAETQLEPYLMYVHSHPMQCKGIQNEICKILTH